MSLTTTEAPPKEAARIEPDPSAPIDLRMVRMAELILDHQNGTKALVLGNYMANNGGLDGVVTRLLWYPGGTVIATVTKRSRTGDEAKSIDKYCLIQGACECEVLDAEARDSIQFKMGRSYQLGSKP